jgi:hypothetical protein
MIDSILVENTEAIKRIDSEIQKYHLKKKKTQKLTQSGEQKLKATTGAAISTGDIAGIKVSVDLHTQIKNQNILRRANVRGNPVHIHINVNR